MTEIKGITFKQDTEHNLYICYVDDFSDELKEKIREMLSSIWHGAVDSAERKQFNYRNTVKRFLERYNSKTSDTKKGMIGELLTHLLIPNYIDLRAISIMKNKEENSIRKGFDVVYCDPDNGAWYCEVKSGGDENITEDINEKNKNLLGAAKRGILELSTGDRSVLWDSVLIDVNSTIFNTDKKFELKALLDSHHPDSDDRDMSRSVILSSVLYKAIDPKICPDILGRYKEGVDSEGHFTGVIVFSIQKPTYQKIETFLVTESNTVTNG